MNAMVKSLYITVNTLRECCCCPFAALHAPAILNNITVTRRRNALALFQSYAEEALASGTPPKGLEQSFAQKLEISPSMWSQVKSSRPIGDKMARQIEQHCGKAPGWLDEERESAGLTPAEQQFLALALQAWRSSNSVGRKALRELLKSSHTKA
jgi:hypothetical protein